MSILYNLDDELYWHPDAVSWRILARSTCLASLGDVSVELKEFTMRELP